MTTPIEGRVCFVVMPISDMTGYEPGHFGRVYEHIFKPAIIAAGFQPVRADDTVKTDYIVAGIIQRVVESSLVLCDISGRNPNVLYELGIRHAFNLPVVLCKDKSTDRIFDIQGLRTADYDESLRVDAVTKDIDRLRAAIEATASPDARDYNSVVQLAGIKAATVPEAQTVTPDTKLLLTAIGSLEKRLSEVASATKRVDQRMFVTQDRIYFADGTTAIMGTEVFRSGKPAGTVIQIDPHEQGFVLRGADGRPFPIRVSDDAARDLSEIPF